MLLILLVSKFISVSMGWCCDTGTALDEDAAVLCTVRITSWNCDHLHGSTCVRFGFTSKASTVWLSSVESWIFRGIFKKHHQGSYSWYLDVPISAAKSGYLAWHISTPSPPPSEAQAETAATWNLRSQGLKPNPWSPWGLFESEESPGSMIQAGAVCIPRWASRMGYRMMIWINNHSLAVHPVFGLTHLDLWQRKNYSTAWNTKG